MQRKEREKESTLKLGPVLNISKSNLTIFVPNKNVQIETKTPLTASKRTQEHVTSAKFSVN